MSFNNEFSFLTRREIKHEKHLFVPMYEPPDEGKEIISSSIVWLENNMYVAEEFFFSFLN